MNTDYHESVMVGEAIEGLGIEAHLHFQAQFIDATLGTGGHALEIVKSGGRVLGIEADAKMLEIATKRLKGALPEGKPAGNCFKLVRGNFFDIAAIAEAHNFTQVDGILFDLGVSNLQLISEERGFSFGNSQAPLDMRIDPESQGVTGADLLNALRPDQLQGLFGEVLEYKQAKVLSEEVARLREQKPFKNVGDFLGAIAVIRAKPGLHPATLPFLALRIAVNSELENLKRALPDAFELLRVGGRLVIISFHSGEDSLVKEFFRKLERLGKAEIITRRPIVASERETEANPRARSAKLRILLKNEN